MNESGHTQTSNLFISTSFGSIAFLSVPLCSVPFRYRDE
jgi:hypothetical protein